MCGMTLLPSGSVFSDKFQVPSTLKRYCFFIIAIFSRYFSSVKLVLTLPWECVCWDFCDRNAVLLWFYDKNSVSMFFNDYHATFQLSWMEIIHHKYDSKWDTKAKIYQFKLTCTEAELKKNICNCFQVHKRSKLMNIRHKRYC